MAEPTISVTYEDLQQSAAIRRGWTTTVADWSADNSAHFAEALRRGLNRFWFPEIASEIYRRKKGQPLENVTPDTQYDYYEWSFLRKKDSTSVTLADGAHSYNLPDDFGGIVDGSVNFAAGQEKTQLSRIDPGTLDTMRSQENATGVPRYYCLRPRTYDGTAGCDWAMEVYPTPTASEAGLVVSYDYQFVPNVIAAGEYPIGGAQHAGTIRAAVLAELEKIIDDDLQGPDEFAFQQAIQASMRLDRQIKLGMSGAKQAYPITRLPSVRLGVDFFELQRAVGKLINYDVNPFLWDHAQTEHVRELIRRGYRKYLYPEALDAQTKCHEWSWIRPTMTFKTAASEKYYLLPDDFERIHGCIYYSATNNTTYPEIRHIPAGMLHQLNSQTDFTSHPAFFATRSMSSDGQGWQRQELILEPTPDAEYALIYEYIASQRELSETHPYPLGPEQLSELLLEACLAVAEHDLTRRLGDHYKQYRMLLVSAVASDLQRAPRYLGYNGNGGPRYFDSRGQARRAGAIAYSSPTYNGVN